MDTIVDELSENFVLVEFADLDGVAFALEPISVGKLIELRHTPAMAAWRLAAIVQSPDIHGMLELGVMTDGYRPQALCLSFSFKQTYAISLN